MMSMMKKRMMRVTMKDWIKNYLMICIYKKLLKDKNRKESRRKREEDSYKE